MTNRFPISPEGSVDNTPSLTMEIILRLKIKDAMVKDLITGRRNSTFRQLQNIMRQNSISGMPILERNRIIGMVSVNDIINALDGGYANETVEKYMTQELIVLEDDMPLTFAVSYFHKYQFHRFPVINKKNEFVGLLTIRDVLAAILNEMNKEIQNLESKLNTDRVEMPNQMIKEFIVKRFDFENAGHASFQLKKMLKEKEISPKIIRRASVAAYELEINIAIHSLGGKIIFVLTPDALEIIAKDTGPGIEDTDSVLQEGYSTANDWIRSLGFGAGMGIPNTKRVSDEFEIESAIGRCTTVRSTIYLEEQKKPK